MSERDALIAGRYRLIRQLAAGGMGTVWLALDTRLERQVALKLLHPQPGLSADDADLVNRRALREARLTARLHHPHAVPVYDVVTHDGQPCLIMQYLPSTSLQARMDSAGRLAPIEVAGIGAQVSSALAAAHEVGIVHRDVKPGNVLIAEDGAAKLTDFGVSHALGDVALTSTGMVTGTPAYLAPEVARGADSGFASDVYSLGATLYAATEGNPPFGTSQNPMAMLHKVAAGTPNPPQRSGPLTPLLLRMLAADPAARPPMIDVSRTLAALHADSTAATLDTARPASGRDEPTTAILPVTAPQPTSRQPAGRRVGAPPVLPPPAGPPNRPEGRPDGNPRREPPDRRLAVVAIIAAVVVIAAVVGGIALLGHGSGNTASPPPTTSASSRPTRTTATSPPATPSASKPTSSAPASPTRATSRATTTAASSAPTTPTASQLARAITDYYALLPANTDAGWARLTPQYQTSRSLGRQNYQSFWDSISRVAVSGASGNPPSTAQATITYYFKDGRVSTELTRFGLVPSGGILKIDSSTVLSSRG